MPAFEHYAEEARQIEEQIVRHGIALGIDWDNEASVRALAREALAFHHAGAPVTIDTSPVARAKTGLFGLAQLMLTVMAESADDDIEIHGGPVWKAFARALWREAPPPSADPSHQD